MKVVLLFLLEAQLTMQNVRNSFTKNTCFAGQIFNKNMRVIANKILDLGNFSDVTASRVRPERPCVQFLLIRL